MVLTKEAKRLDVSFQFNPVVYWLGALGVESLRVKTDEALAITSSFQLHLHLAFDDGCTAAKDNSNKAERQLGQDAELTAAHNTSTTSSRSSASLAP